MACRLKCTQTAEPWRIASRLQAFFFYGLDFETETMALCLRHQNEYQLVENIMQQLISQDPDEQEEGCLALARITRFNTVLRPCLLRIVCSTSSDFLISVKVLKRRNVSIKAEEVTSKRAFSFIYMKYNSVATFSYCLEITLSTEPVCYYKNASMFPPPACTPHISIRRAFFA